MPFDWRRWSGPLAVTVLAIAIIAVLYVARSLLVPIALAIFLTFVLSPLVSWLQRRGLGRTSAVIFVVLGVLLGSMGIGGAIAHQVVRVAGTLPDRKEAIKEKLLAAKEWLVGNGDNRFGQFLDDVEAVILPKREHHQAVVVEAASPPLTAQLQPFISPSVEILGQAALTLILTVYMLIRREDLRNRIIRLVGAGKVTTTTKAVDEASQRISRYLLMQLLINTAFGLTISLGLLLLGLQDVLLWGFIATLMRYVPYVGSWIGLIPPVLFSIATAPAWAGGWGQPIAIFVWYLGFELICANVVEPWLYGESMGLSEVAQLLSTAFWAYLWGPIGLILASPLTACLLVLGKYVPGAEFLEVILGDRPALEPPIAFYQRLAARDQDEASEVALTVARASSPDVALETVVIPALGLARRDHDRGDLDLAAFRRVVHGSREVVEEIRELHEISSETSSEDDHQERVRVLICPSRDEAEHLAAGILEGILDRTKWEVRVAGDALLASELVAAMEEFQPEVLVLVALPPGGMSHCRYLVSRVRARFADIKILVGRWGNEKLLPLDSPDSLKRVDAEDRSLSGTLKRLTELHPVLVAKLERRAADDVTRKTGNSGQSKEQGAFLSPVNV
jgi:predicted PurR-regulated permease PerM